MKTQHNHITTPCRTYRRSASHLLELPVTDPERREWERHADLCEHCHELIEAHSRIVTALHSLPKAQPAFVAGRVMSEVRRRGQRRESEQPRVWVWGLGGVLLGSLVGLVLAAYLPANSTTGQDTSDRTYSIALADGLDQSAYDLAGYSTEATK